ncbi:MAG: 30S ribosomal protein S20 [Planctomycetes bacterium]|nr:30S ribosomal protein S20 [Planctomycetota bacterium]MCH8121368.1 30S ribosomal protein S20 [Planctomycetota bacterium]
MAQSLQAKKRAKQNIKSRTTNRARKSRIKTQIKHFETAVSEGNVEAASEQYKLVVKKLDKAASTSTMHKKTAARKKSRLAKKLNALKVKE